MKGIYVVAVAVLVAALGIGHSQADEDTKGRIEVRVERLEAGLARMDARLQELERKLSGPQPLKLDLASRIEETINLKQLVGAFLTMNVGKFPRRKNGALDLYAIATNGDVSMKDAVALLKSPRSGEGPSAEEIKNGDYKNCPYFCAGEWCTRQGVEVVPMFFEKRPDKRGKIVVAFNNGSVKYMDRAEVARMLKAAAFPEGK